MGHIWDTWDIWDTPIRPSIYKTPCPFKNTDNFRSGLVFSSRLPLFGDNYWFLRTVVSSSEYFSSCTSFQQDFWIQQFFLRQCFDVTLFGTSSTAGSDESKNESYGQQPFLVLAKTVILNLRFQPEPLDGLGLSTCCEQQMPPQDRRGQRNSSRFWGPDAWLR